jgi:hypothetical protein
VVPNSPESETAFGSASTWGAPSPGICGPLFIAVTGARGERGLHCREKVVAALQR